MEAVLRQLAPIYEKDTGNKLAMTFLTTNMLKDEVDRGAKFDVLILVPVPGMVAALVKAGKLAPKLVPIAKCGLGAAFRPPAPDISTPEKFKEALVAAKTIAYTSTGQSGIYLQQLIARMGIADQVRAKGKVIPTGQTAAFVAKGEADMAIQLIPELNAVAGVQVVPFPAEVQHYLDFSGGVNPTTKRPNTAAAFLTYLTGPKAETVIKAKAMEPGN
jgi:molybdate transport system substrate-binding protein